MVETVDQRTLKSGPRRSVRVETAPDGSRCVVKSFDSRSPAGVVLDRARAAREHRLLTELSQRGLPVPRPMSLEKCGEAWQVRMQCIDGAVALADVLAGRAAWPFAPERAARELGRLLARLHAAGLDHADLHAGNALLAADASVWAIDFHQARRVRRVRTRTMLRDLVSLAAGVRELVHPRFRARFFVAWRAALPAELREAAFDGAEFALEIERSARARRVAVVRRRRARWTRAGTACSAFTEPFRGFVRHGVEMERALELDRIARARGRTEGARADIAGTSAGDPVVLVTGLSAREARHVWWNAARLEEHALPAARPLVFATGPVPWIAASVPIGAHGCASALRTRRGLYSLGALCAKLADRELVPASGAGALLWCDARGEVLLGPTLDLRHEPRSGNGVDTVRALALAGLSIAELSRAERAAYAAGILAGVELGSAARAKLRADLRHG